MAIEFDKGMDMKHKKPLHDDRKHAEVEVKQTDFKKRQGDYRGTAVGAMAC